MPLLKNLGADDANYIEQIYREYYDYLYNVAKIIEYDEEIVKESVQDTFLTAVKKLTKLRKHPNKRKWLTRILRNKIKENIRKYKSPKHNSSNVIIYTLSYEEMLKITNAIGINDIYFYETPSTELMEKFEEILSDTEIKFLKYKYIIGYSNKEISQILGISYSNVSTIGSRIRKKIKKYIKK